MVVTRGCGIFIKMEIRGTQYESGKSSREIWIRN